MLQHVTVVVLVVASLSMRAVAQDTAQGIEQDSVSPTEEQARLYVAAHDAYRRGQWAEVIAHLEEARAYGEINILHLSLGLALARSGRCDEAEAHFARVPTAPAAAHPPREEVLSRLEDYRAEARTLCAAEVEERAEAPAEDAPTTPDPAPISLPSHPPVPETSSDAPLPWTVVAAASGGALLAFGIVADLALLGPAVSDFEAAKARGDGSGLAAQTDAETWRALALVGYIGGAVLSAAAATLFLLDRGESEESLAVEPVLTPHAFGLSLRRTL